jgi:hypothetical protein
LTVTSVVNDEDSIVVAYKATSKKGEVSLDAHWQVSYKRQMEIYQWLLRKNGLPVSNQDSQQIVSRSAGPTELGVE